MQTRLPDTIDPWKLAGARARVGGSIPLQGMRRLASLLARSEGEVQVVIQAGMDEEQDVCFIAGHLDVTVEMACQRCMESMPVPLAVDFRLGLIRSNAQAAALPPEYEPLLAPGGALSMSELVEDELILALPLVPMHPDVSQCEARGFAWPSECGARQSPVQPDNPFAVLSTLLKDAQTRND